MESFAAISVDVDWKPIAIGVLLVIGVLAILGPAVLKAIPAALGKLKEATEKHHAAVLPDPKSLRVRPPENPTTERRADDPCPAGAVEWAREIAKISGAMPAEFFREQILAGASIWSATLAKATKLEKQIPPPNQVAQTGV